MKRLARILLAAAAFLAPAVAAYGQGTVLQGGSKTAGHAPMYTTSSGQTIVQDSGAAGGGGVGVGLSELLRVARGTGSAPYAGQGTGPYGTIDCQYDAPTNNSTGYHYLCMSPNAQGGALIAIGAGGTASQLPFSFIINGATYQFPFTVGGITGPGSSVINDLACWNNTAGSLLKDCGASVVSGLLTLGTNASVAGAVALANPGVGGASVTVKNPSTTVAYNYNLPATAGTTGQVATSGGGGTSPNTWTDPSITINGTLCSLGSSCSISGASAIAVGSTTITGGTNGRVLRNNSGVLGEYSVTGTGNAVLSASPTLSGSPVLGTPSATSLVINGATLGGNALAVTGSGQFSGELDTSHLFVGSGASSASTHAILITKNFAPGNDVAGIQNSFTATGTSADVAGMFVAPSIANGGVVADLYGVRVETVNLIGTAALSIYKAYRVDDLTSLTVGTSKWAFYAEGSGDGGKARFGKTLINADTFDALTVGNGTASTSAGIIANGGGSGNGSGAYFTIQGGGTNQSFFGGHSAIFGGAYNSVLSITSASTKAIEIVPGLTGAAFSQTVTTTFNSSGGVGFGTATDPGAGGLLATGSIKSNSATAGIGYATGAGCNVTQGTSRTTSVTCNGTSGKITLVSAAGSGTTACFTVNNTSVAANDTISISQLSGTDRYIYFVGGITAATSFNFCQNDQSGTTTEQPVFQFNVLKGVQS